MKTTHTISFLQLSVALGCTMSLIPFAQAQQFSTPLDSCPAIIAVKGGYRLTQDTTCPISWVNDNNKFLDLDGHTLTNGVLISVQGIGQTIRNGTLITSGMDWAFSNMGKLSNLTIKYSGIPVGGFFIEAGSNFTVKNSIFINIPGAALDFYYGNGGKVKNSTFIGNGTGISVQLSDNVSIENNKFTWL